MSLKLGLRNKIRRSRAAGGFVGLLDQPFATGATAAYSLRLLREKHSGGLVRVRADDSGTDKGEADVLGILQPDGSKIITLNSPIENLNSKAQTRLGVPAGGGDKVLADLVDAGGQNFDGFASNWYGQTPNTNDATQSNASQQPQIVSSGSVIQENGKPAIEFDGANHFLTLSKAGVFDADVFTILMVYKPEAKTNGRVYDARGLGGSTDDKGHTYRVYAGSDIGIIFNDLSNSLFSDDSETLNQKIQSIFWNADSNSNKSTLRYKRNSNKIVTPSLISQATVNSNPANVYIDVKGGDIVTIAASNESTSQYYTGKLQELIFFSGLENENLNNPVNNHYSIF